jgi:mono/diheme cytochrome c family protein
MKKPFEAEMPAAAVTAGDPLVVQGGKIFAAQSCNACHGDGGVGGPAGTALIGIHQRLDADRLTALLKSPTPIMTAGGMQPLDLPPDDMKPLVAYLSSL